MIEVIAHSGAKPRPVHPGQIDRALSDIGNEALREAILRSPRFADRIVRRLSGVHDDVCDLPQNDPVAMVAARLGPAFLTLLGHLWFAPQIASTVMMAKSRAIPGLEDRARLRLILLYRDHVDPVLIGPLPEAPDFEGEGAQCLGCWLEARQDCSAARRLHLVLPPSPSTYHAKRAALVDRVLTDPQTERA